MDPLIAVVVGVAIFVILTFVLGMPLAFSLAIGGLAGLALLKDVGVSFDMLRQLPYGRVTQYLLTVMPMFILMGQLAFAAGLSVDTFNAGHKWLGRVPGGVGVATVFGCAAFGACCGSSLAEGAAMGKVAIPEMRRLGYDKRLACGLVATAGMLALLIPPSVGFVIYGFMTQESIGKLLVAGIMPGILTAVALSIYVILIGIVAPAMAPRGVKVSWKERLSSIPGLLPVGILFIVVMGGIWGGIFTATEAGSLGALGTFVIALVALSRGRTTWGAIKEALLETAYACAMIFFLLIGAGLFTVFLGLAGVPKLVGDFILSSGMSPMGVIWLICLAYLPLGMFLDPMSIQLLTLPIIYPAIIAMGFDGIWFGVIIVILVEISMLTPPVALNVFVIKGAVPDATLEDVYIGALPFIALEALVLVILVYFPQISLWLPGMMK